MILIYSLAGIGALTAIVFIGLGLLLFAALLLHNKRERDEMRARFDAAIRAGRLKSEVEKLEEVRRIVESWETAPWKTSESYLRMERIQKAVSK